MGKGCIRWFRINEVNSLKSSKLLMAMVRIIKVLFTKIKKSPSEFGGKIWI